MVWAVRGAAIDFFSSRHISILSVVNETTVGAKHVDSILKSLGEYIDGHVDQRNSCSDMNEIVYSSCMWRAKKPEYNAMSNLI